MQHVQMPGMQQTMAQQHMPAIAIVCCIDNTTLLMSSIAVLSTGIVNARHASNATAAAIAANADVWPTSTGTNRCFGNELEPGTNEHRQSVQLVQLLW